MLVSVYKTVGMRCRTRNGECTVSGVSTIDVLCLGLRGYQERSTLVIHK